MKTDFVRRSILVSEKPRTHISILDNELSSHLPTLIFLHSYGGQAKDWQGLLSLLSTKTRVIAIDLRGHGQSDGPLTSSGLEPYFGDWARAVQNRDSAAGMNALGIGHYHDMAEGIRGLPPYKRRRIAFTMSLLVNDLEIAVKELRIQQPIILVGRSFGAAIAVEYAGTHPDQVKRVMLVGLRDRYQLRPIYQSLFSLPYSLLRVLAPMLQVPLAASPLVLKSMYRYAVRSWNNKEQLGFATSQSIFIHCDADRFFSREQNQTDSIPSANTGDTPVDWQGELMQALHQSF